MEFSIITGIPAAVLIEKGKKKLTDIGFILLVFQDWIIQFKDDLFKDNWTDFLDIGSD